MKLAMCVSLSGWVWEAQIHKLGAVSSYSRILCSQNITCPTPTFWLWPTEMQWPDHCPHAVHFVRRAVLSLHKTQTQILLRNWHGTWNLPAQDAVRLCGRQRAQAVVPLGWPQILTLLSVLSNEPEIDGIVPFHCMDAVSRTLQCLCADQSRSWQCLKKMVKNHLWASSDWSAMLCCILTQMKQFVRFCGDLHKGKERSMVKQSILSQACTSGKASKDSDFITVRVKRGRPSWKTWGRCSLTEQYRNAVSTQRESVLDSKEQIQMF